MLGEAKGKMIGSEALNALLSSPGTLALPFDEEVDDGTG